MQQRSIAVETSSGSAEGYVDSTDHVTLDNWLANRHRIENWEEIAAYVRAKYQSFAVLNNINIDQGQRGAGRGTILLLRFINEAGNAPILLLADAGESQAEGFGLAEWYQRHGFKVLLETGAGPLMIREPKP